MSKILLYFDEDAMDEDLVQALRSRSVDVATAAEVGMLHHKDEKQLNWAKENNRVLYTYNVRDFYQLHTSLLTQGLAHRGIILAPQQRYSIGEQLRGVLRLTTVKTAEEMQNQVEFLSNWV